MISKGQGGTVAQTFFKREGVATQSSRLLRIYLLERGHEKIEITGGPLRRYNKLGINSIVAGVQDYLHSVHNLFVGFRIPKDESSM